jgi:retron-type reverse transcriptase
MFNLVVFIHLKKAFDTVDHEILLEKMQIYGIKDKAHLLLRSYLILIAPKKWQVNGVVSSEHKVKFGVPQGSILGPLFFLIYINDLSECLNRTKPRLFADDTNLSASGGTINGVENAVNSDLENLRM